MRIKIFKWYECFCSLEFIKLKQLCVDIFIYQLKFFVTGVDIYASTTGHTNSQVFAVRYGPREN